MQKFCAFSPVPYDCYLQDNFIKQKQTLKETKIPTYNVFCFVYINEIRGKIRRETINVIVNIDR